MTLPPPDRAGLAAVPRDVAAAFAAGGVRAALAALNARTACRYTALFLFADPALPGLHFFDRRDPAAGPGDDLPVSAVYGVYVREANRPFVMADALAHIRADACPHCTRLRAYVGVPVRAWDDRVVGVLCHFDPHPQDGLEAELGAMERSAAALFVRPEGAR